ncbi:MAG TPA: ankyrin repeat domain-containing protein, partial [Campylobacterales bacterium]|nr:ankyrin repeat domain-containing protein [Campylobacterales bacterium]
TNNGNTLLHAAANSNNYNIAKLLIAKGLSVTSKNLEGKTPLYFSASNAYNDEDVEVLKLLLSSGADIMAKNNDGLTALDIAIENQCLRAVSFLVLNTKNLTKEQAKAILPSYSIASQIFTDNNIKAKMDKLFVGHDSTMIMLQSNNASNIRIDNISIYVNGKIVGFKSLENSSIANSKKLFEMVSIDTTTLMSFVDGKNRVVPIKVGMKIQYSILGKRMEMLSEKNSFIALQ